MKRFPHFDKEVSFLKAKVLGLNYQGVISESALRAETETTDGTGTYTFDFKASKGTKVPQERLLADNDLFRVLGVRFFLLSRTTANRAIAVPQTFPNAIIFDDETNDSPAGTFVTEHLEAFYNAGYLTYKKGDTTYLPYLPLKDARFVAQTQQSSAANKSSTEMVAPGMIVLSRPFHISGIDQGELSIVVPDAAALKIQYSTAANAGKRIVLGVELLGILVSGGSKIATAAGSQMI